MLVRYDANLVPRAFLRQGEGGEKPWERGCYETTDGGSWSFVDSNVPVMNESYVSFLFVYVLRQESLRIFFFSQAIRAVLKFTSLAKRSVEFTKSMPMAWEILKCIVITKRQAEVGRSFKKDETAP